ncbi:hypothetical protein [Sphingomonas sp. ERG5]|uniref:hypothetical protein n=1 Tax=Sphingomonas sp. ERG5 TaxID=1381597 RepID=UPI00054BE882|nr:hypothetical protein [Sphingomonas sp. ERG5]
MKKFAILSTVMLLGAALPVHAQRQAPLQPTEDPRPMQALDPIEGPAPVEARQTVARYGACVADHSPEKARAVLLLDFHSGQYRTGLRALSDNNRGCFGRRGKMRSDPVLFAGAIAERLLERGDGVLKARLARAAAGAAPATFGPSDALAQCVVRSVPDDVDALLAAEVATDAEANALRALDLVAKQCGQGRQVDISAGGMRAILAASAFRNVEALK